MLLFRRKNLLSHAKILTEKLLSTSSGARASLVSEQLVDRAAVGVGGAEATPFLQGLITNDIHLLNDDNVKSMFTVFLNVQGRIMFDTIIFRRGDEYLVDCDAKFASHLVKHLKMYKVRRQIEVELCDDIQPWSIFESEETKNISEDLKLSDFLESGIVASPDPRFSGLGFRVLASRSKVPDILTQNLSKKDSFKELRHRQAVSEGGDEIPFGKCFPLEYNVDFLHGVDFHKGCYIGQELTARTHHTGVVRKRILPIQKVPETGQAIETGQTIVNESGKNVGQVRGVSDRTAIGLMRVEECSAAKSLSVKETGQKVTLIFPEWWTLKK